MDSKSKSVTPLRLFVNPLATWTDLVFKTGQAMWASTYAAVLESKTAPKIAVIPPADAPGHAPRKAVAAVRKTAKAVRVKAARTKPRVKGKRRAKR
jgi:hypothetical protein